MRIDHWNIIVILASVATSALLYFLLHRAAPQSVLIELAGGFELEAKSFGDATIAIDNDVISLLGSGREGGVVLSAPNSAGPARVYGFTVSDSDPAIIRIQSSSGRTYKTSDELTELILGSFTVKSYLIYREHLSSLDLKLSAVAS